MSVAVDDVTRLPRVMNYDEPEVSPMMSETAAVVRGGAEQNRYNEWRDAVMAAEDRLWHTESLLGATNHVVSNETMNRPQSELDSLKMMALEQRKAVERINDDFINAHPDYVISLILQLKNWSGLIVIRRICWNPRQTSSRATPIRCAMKGFLPTYHAI